jgi:hypothetical protein
LGNHFTGINDARKIYLYFYTTLNRILWVVPVVGVMELPMDVKTMVPVVLEVATN